MVTAPATPLRARATSRDRSIRTDIQVLRAYAVLGVVLYHLWPHALPGGYVGVDVFFVISGFLITAQLIRRRERGRIGLGEFWAARARRLLPASLIVLTASIVMTVVWAPATLIVQYLRSIIGSALYVENWVLAADSVDYLAHDNAPPIAQHFWSLSVEEQFYLLWPLLIIAATLGATQVAARKRVLIAGGATLAVVSLALSIWLTANSPAYAYFSTPSRMWEFALGGLVALLPVRELSRRTRTIAWVLAWAALLATLFAFNASTPFPGPAALVPTVAAATLILIGPQAPSAAIERLAGAAPVQWIGDQSYGIYLWHWPLIVIAPALLGHAPGLLGNLTILALTIVLAATVKRFVEDPIRFGSRARTMRKRTVGIATLAAMAIVVGAAATPLVLTVQSAAAQEAESEKALTSPEDCLGANALLAADCASARTRSTPATELIPSLAGLYDDTGGAFECYDATPVDDPTVCSFGSQASDARHIALVGDSHAAMLIPGLRTVAESRGWHIDTFVGRGCDISDDACARRQAAIDKRLTSGDYDVVLETARNSPDYSEATIAGLTQRFEARWRAATGAGATVVAIADNPFVPTDSFGCLSARDAFDASTCAFPEPSDLLARDPLRAAARATDTALIDMTDAFCRDGSCSIVEGGVVVWRDQHHITASFSKTMAPYLADRITAALTEHSVKG